MDAAKKKSLSPAGLMALRVLLLLVVGLCLGQTRVWGLDAAPHLASGQIAFASASAVGEIAVAFAYDASGSLVAAETTTAIQPMADAAFGTGSIRTVAGYEVAGNAGLVGQTYNVNVWGLYATENSQGLVSLSNALRAEASAAGASQISITGNAVVNEGLLNISTRAAGRLGFTINQVNPATILLQGAAP